MPDARAQAKWPTHLSLREHSFFKIGEALADEPGFPLNGTEVQKADYIFSRLPKVVDHYGLTAGTGGVISGGAVGGLRMFDGLDVESNASLKSALALGNCSEFTFMFQDLLKGAKVQGHVIYGDDDQEKGYSKGFTGTDTALYVDEVGPDGVVVRRVFDAFRATYHHQEGKPWKETLAEWGNRPMTRQDKLSRDPKDEKSWLEHLGKSYAKDQQTEDLVPANTKAPKSKADVDSVLKNILGLWQTPKGAQILIRGTNGSIEGVYVKRTPQQRVQGMPDNAFYFRNGTLKLGPPLVLESKNGWNYPQISCNKSLQPFTKCDARITFTPALTSARFSRRAPQYWTKPCQWALGEQWYTEEWQGTKVLAK
jgi:hypothetical protein